MQNVHEAVRSFLEDMTEKLFLDDLLHSAIDAFNINESSLDGRMIEFLQGFTSISCGNTE